VAPIDALRGTWNIVPTPFLPSGELDTGSIPGLVSFVRGTGVDGMTILGVLGEAGRLGDAERSAVIDAVLAANPEQVETYRGGKEGVLGFFVGQVMRETQGKADPKVVNRLLRETLQP